MTDVVGVANVALGRLGVGKAIASLSENSVEARTCARFYDLCRQEVLRAFPWNFALKAEALAAISGQEFPGWGYVYQYPSGCLNMRAVGDEGGVRVAHYYASCNDPAYWAHIRTTRIPWQVALKTDGASRVVLCDMDDAWAFYTTDVENAGAWSPDFASVLAWRWAMEVGGPLSAKSDLVTRATQMFSIWLREATAISLNEQRDDVPADSGSISCRY